MNKISSPLRYPGGKSCLYELTSRILTENKLTRRHYVEPYAGVCGLALSLLFGGCVSDIHINDVDPAIWSFWVSVLTQRDDLIALIREVPVTVEEWHIQRKIHQAADSTNPLQLGFATFFLNRTNRSGVISGAGVIGGQAQTGNYKLDCRFNKEVLSSRIERIVRYRDRIHLTNEDAIPFMKRADAELPDSAFFCIDPPYFSKGASLYTNYYGPHEHSEVAQAVLKLKNQWIVTYDRADEICEIYASRRQFFFSINYSVQTKRVGSELLVASKRLKIPQALNGILVPSTPAVLSQSLVPSAL